MSVLLFKLNPSISHAHGFLHWCLFLHVICPCPGRLKASQCLMSTCSCEPQFVDGVVFVFMQESQISRQRRTVVPSVPQNAEQEARSLFAKEVSVCDCTVSLHHLMTCKNPVNKGDMK